MWEPRKPVIRLWTSITLAAPKRARREKISEGRYPDRRCDAASRIAPRRVAQSIAAPGRVAPGVPGENSGLGRTAGNRNSPVTALSPSILDTFRVDASCPVNAHAHLAFRNGSLAALVPMPCRADAFCLGVLCALAFRTPALWQRVNAKRAVILWATGGMAILLLWLAYGWPTTLGLSRAQCSPAATPWSHVSTRAAW